MLGAFIPVQFTVAVFVKLIFCFFENARRALFFVLFSDGLNKSDPPIFEFSTLFCKNDSQKMWVFNPLFSTSPLLFEAV